MSQGKTKITVATIAVTASLVAVLASCGRPAAQKAPQMPGIQLPVPVDRPLVSPFTGERVKSLGPVLAVKIDNIVFARPQTGLTHADIVYVIPVEGGLSRFMAIFSSHIPSVIGPVRSAREDDLELLRQFGRPAFAYSGAQGRLLPVVERSRIIDLYAGKVVKPYYRDYRRIAPYNLYAHTHQLLAAAKDASWAHSIGFRFGPAPFGGQPVTTVRTGYAAASYAFKWSATRNRWLVSMDGARAMTTDAGQLSAATVVIQHTVVRTSRYLEYGVPPPYAESVGHGTAEVLRNGRAYQVHWSRPNWYVGTTFTTASGQRMNFAPGPVWIVLVR